MATEIYGASDDLIEIEGDITAEHNHYNTTEDQPAAIFFSDGTVLGMHYSDDGIWKIDVKEKGALFDHIEPCTDADAEPHSDKVFFKSGLAWAYALDASEGLERVN